MAVLNMPVRSDLGAYQFTIELERVNYIFRFRFNGRLGRWIMDIAKTDETTILGGIPLLSNVDLIGRFRKPELPPGGLMVYDQTGKNESPGPDNFGTTVQLLYVESISL